jgi:DNA-binding protein HU-beta
MNKAELIAKVTETTGLSKKDVTTALESTLEVITEALSSGDKVSIVGFGNFEVRDRAARKGRNPQTGEELNIAASKAPAFKASKKLKESVNA